MVFDVVVFDNNSQSYCVGLTTGLLCRPLPTLEVTITTPTVFQIKALRRNFRNYAAVDIFKTFGFTEPMVSDTKDWAGSLQPYYQRAATHLASKGVTYDQARAANGFWKKQRNRGTAATGLAKLSFEGAAVSWGKAAVPVAATVTAAPAAGDPRQIAALRFAKGEISITEFTSIVEALNAAFGATPVKTVEAPVVETVELDATGSDELPF